MTETGVLRTEYAWLVENGDSGAALRYRMMDEMGIHWTEDANKAIRFARRADAEMFAAGDEDAWRVVEHGWTTLDGDLCERDRLQRRLGAINTLACYASEEDTDAQPQALLTIGRIARGEEEPLWPII